MCTYLNLNKINVNKHKKNVFKSFKKCLSDLLFPLGH